MYVVADGMELPFRSDGFSNVISSEVLEHLEDDGKALEEMAKVLKLSRVLIITFPHRRFYFACDDRFVKHFHRYELPEMEIYLREAGLHPVLVRKVLGPLEKISMCIGIFFFRSMQKLRMAERTNVRSSGLGIVFSFLFKWINRLYVGPALLDAIVMPRALSAVLLMNGVKE